MPASAAHTPVRPNVLRLIWEAESAAPGDPMSDEAYFLAQLRAAITAGDSPMDRLRSRYGIARGDQLSRLYARYAD